MFGVSEEDHEVQSGLSTVSKKAGWKGLAQKGNVWECRQAESCRLLKRIKWPLYCIHQAHEFNVNLPQKTHLFKVCPESGF